MSEESKDYTYEILKLVESGKERIFPEDVGLSKEDFLECMLDIHDDDMVDNIGIVKSAGVRSSVYTNNLTLKKEGKKYIELKEQGKI